MSTCENCGHWKLTVIRRYTNTELIDDLGDGTGKYPCRIPEGPTRDIFFPATFGCLSFVAATSPMDHHAVVERDGEPWQFWEMVPCPDCRGAGSSNDAACDRCAGTGNVRSYEDGYVGEEKTREHPVEKELRLAKVRDEAEQRALADVAAAAEPPAPVVPEEVSGTTGSDVKPWAQGSNQAAVL